MFGHSKEIKDLYTAYSEKVQLQEDKKDKKEKGIGLEGSINVPGLGKTIETRKNNKKEDKKDKKEKGIGLEGSINVPGLGKTIETRKKNIKSELTDKDKDDDKKEKELEFVVNKSKKGDYKKIESDSKSNKGNNTLVSLSGSKDSKDDDKVGGSTTSGTIKQQDHHQSKVIAQFKKEQESKKQKEASDDEKGANEWGPGGQPSASKQIDAYKKGRPSPASFKTNQRQTRELVKNQSKEVYPTVTKKDLNQFNRTKKYSADDGSQVERSTVFTKHYKTGKPLGVMTGSQRKAYDKAAAAYKAQPTPTPKPVETKPDTSFKSNKEKDTFKRRDQKLLDKGLKPPKYEKDSPTYTTKIGAFLNNKKVGDVKNKSKHTKVTSVMDMESYDAYDLVLDYIMESKQASSIEEANYIMLEMDQNTIHEIVQEQKKNINEGLKTAIGIGLLATPYLMKKFGKKPVDKMIKNKRKTSTIGGENRKDKIEKATGVDLDNW